MSSATAENIALAAFLATVLVFVGFCLIVGTRRWNEVRRTTKSSTDLAVEAIADRKKILAVLEEIKLLLEKQNNGRGPI